MEEFLWSVLSILRALRGGLFKLKLKAVSSYQSGAGPQTNREAYSYLHQISIDQRGSHTVDFKSLKINCYDPWLNEVLFRGVSHLCSAKQIKSQSNITCQRYRPQ